MSLADEIEHYKKNIENMKTSINEYQSQIDRLNHQLNNLNTNRPMFETRRRGKTTINPLVMTTNERETSVLVSTYPLSFVLFLMTCGLILGAYLNKLLYH
jgi:prefoldin subunit 5